METVNINITGLNTKQIKVFKQAFDRINLLSQIHENILKAKKQDKFYTYIHHLKEDIVFNQKDYYWLKEDCAENFNVNFYVLNVGLKRPVFHFTVINKIEDLNKAIAYVFYNLKP